MPARCLKGAKLPRNSYTIFLGYFDMWLAYFKKYLGRLDMFLGLFEMCLGSKPKFLRLET